MNVVAHHSLLLTSLGAGILCLVVASCYQHCVSSHYAKARLLKEFTALPLSHLITQLGIPLMTYLHKAHWTLLGQQVEACKTCKHLHQCEKCVAKGVHIVDVEDCPNYSFLKKIAPHSIKG